MKYFSVIGDSISTFEGTMPAGYALYYDKETQKINRFRGVDDMWWAIVGKALGAELLVNGSWSGGRVTGDFPGACSEERVAALRTVDAVPDYILIYIGLNDFGNGVKLYKDDPQAPDPLFFASAYRLMLRRLKEAYPDAHIYCGALMLSQRLGDTDWDLLRELGRTDLPAFNGEIRAAAEEYGCEFVDLFSGGCRYNALDGVHPTAGGHAQIAAEWKEACK